MVENLSIGIDPISGRVLPKGDSCANEIVQESLKIVLKNCTAESYATVLMKQHQEKRDAVEERKRLKETKYTNSGTVWTKEEEAELSRLFQDHVSVADLSETLRRTPAAIEGRLVKLGLMKRCETSNYQTVKKYLKKYR